MLFDEGIAVLLGDEHVVGGDAGLAGVEPLAPGETATGDLDVGRVVDEHRALAAELEDDRREVTSGGLVDDAADVGGARVEDVVEALLEQIGRDGDVALDDGDGLGVDIAGDQLGERLAGLAGDLGRLGDDGIAGGDGGGHRQEQQLDRVVPRARPPGRRRAARGRCSPCPASIASGRRTLRGLAHLATCLRMAVISVAVDPMSAAKPSMAGLPRSAARAASNRGPSSLSMRTSPSSCSCRHSIGLGAPGVVGLADAGDDPGHVDGGRGRCRSPVYLNDR